MSLVHGSRGLLAAAEAVDPVKPAVPGLVQCDGLAERAAGGLGQQRQGRLEVSLARRTRISRLEAEHDLWAKVADAIGALEERIGERHPDPLVTDGDPGLAVVWCHRQIQ